jgi:hypothetical protein
MGRTVLQADEIIFHSVEETFDQPSFTCFVIAEELEPTPAINCQYLTTLHPGHLLIDYNLFAQYL